MGSVWSQPLLWGTCRSCQQSNPVIRLAVLTEKVTELCIDNSFIPLFSVCGSLKRLVAVYHCPHDSTDNCQKYRH